MGVTSDLHPPTETVPDYEIAKQWEFDATVQSLLSVKDDLEPLPLFDHEGRQVGIGVGLYWWTGKDGGLQWTLSDDSRECRVEYEDEDEWWPLRDMGDHDGLASDAPY